MATFTHLVIPAVAISQEERTFFVALGARIAHLRKELGITQVQFAELLGTSQQAVTAYEVGRRRVPVSSLPLMARTLHVSLEELIGEEPTRTARKRGPAPKLKQQMERITLLPKAQQRFVMQMIDTVLQQSSR
jgi:transcriptional regulator with XRE-family HTH domain